MCCLEQQARGRCPLWPQRLRNAAQAAGLTRNDWRHRYGLPGERVRYGTRGSIEWWCHRSCLRAGPAVGITARRPDARLKDV